MDGLLGILCGGEVIDAVNLPEPLRAADADAGAGADDSDLSLHAATARLERRLITRALERAKGNRSASARLLGIGRPLLYAKIEEHDLGPRTTPTDDATDEDSGSTGPK